MFRSSSVEIQGYMPRVALMFALLCPLAGCPQASSEPTAPPASSGTQASEIDIAVLPNNTTIHSSRTKVSAVGSDGAISWQLALPDGDMVIAPVAVALNSVAYVRGSKAIHAMLPDGKWLWSKPLDGRSFAKTRAADSPVATSDSTVALVVGDDVLRFDHTGAVRFRVSVPEGHVTGRPIAGMDGSLLVPTTSGLYSITPDGNFAWRSNTIK
jgi:hypothetical protein